jgi:hypothetical protein
MPNLLQKASIVLTPTAYNDGEVLCAKPDDGSGDFDFSRNSAATRVNAQGLVENVQILSSNLVQNGNFSEEGTEEISNGSFSQEGSDIIVNGDFAFNSNWSGTNTIANGQLTIGSGGGIVYQGTLDGTIKSYKVTINVAEKNGVSLNLYLGGNQFSLNEGVQTLYVQSGNSNTFIGFNNGADSVINSISCVEVGQDWTLGTGWSIGEDKAVATNVNSTFLAQNSILTSGKTYKITYTVQDYVSGTIRFRSNLVNGSTNLGNGTYTDYIVSNGTQFALQGRSSFNGSITNISVKEVGMDWQLGSFTSIGNNVANIVNSTGELSLQQNIGVSQKTIKLTYTISNYASGAIRPQYGAVNGLARSANGTYTEIITGISGSSNLAIFSVTTNTTATITNISAIEITDDTNLPRINYEGFSYQDVLGSELITNGSFDDGTNNWTQQLNVNFSVDNGVATIQSTGNNSLIYQYISPSSVSAILKIEFDVVSFSGSYFYISLGGYSTQITQTGKVVIYTTSNRNSNKFDVAPQPTTTVKLNNVSVKEYLGQEVVPNSGCGSWLWEPQSTNLLEYSENFISGNWAADDVTISSDLSVSPSGESYSQIMVVNTVASRHNIKRTKAGVNTATLSIFAKAKELNYIQIASANTTGQFANFDLSNGTIGSVGSSFSDAKIEDYGNGWYRCSVVSDNQYNQAIFSLVTSSTSPWLEVWTSANNTDGLYIWGAMLDENSFITSYIPTSGSTVTRNQDLCTNGGSLATINSTEGVLYAEVDFNQTGLTNGLYAISDGTFNNYLMVRFSPTNKIQVEATGGVNIIETSVRASGSYKTAVKYSSSGVELWVDGTKIIETSTQISISGINQIMIAKSPFGNIVGCKTKALAVWKEALSDQELADLTYPTPTDPTFTLDFDTIAEQFTFARGSEATYVDAQGLIKSTNELGEELITNGDFSNGSTDWTLGTGWTISGGTANYDGLQAYQLLRQGTANGVIGKTYIVKYDVSNNNGVGGIIAKFGGVNLSSYNSNNGSFEYYVDAISTDYIRFTPQLDFNGSIDNVSVKEVISATNTPRLDYSTGAEAFLLEPQSTNLINYSSDFTTGTGWGEARCTLDSNVLISPDGQQTASELTDTTAPGDRGLSQINSSLASNDYALFSMFLKAGTNRYGLLYLIDNAANINGGANSFTIVIDLQDGIITDTGVKEGTPQNTTYGIESYNNGWYRVYIGLQKQGNATRTDLRFLMYNSSTWSAGQGYVGDGTGTNYIWGGQLEAQSYPTSYIPSNGSQTTRNQETCINATPEINSEEGVLYAEIASLSNEVPSNYISLSDGTYNNRISILYSVGTNIIRGFLRLGGVSQADLSFAVSDITEFHKVAFKFKENDFALWVDGVEVATDTNGSILPNGTLTKLAFSEISTTGGAFRGNTKDVQVYTKALSDAELIKLTT